MTQKRAQEIGRALLDAGCGWREGMRASCYADWGTVTRVFDHDDGTQTVYASFDHESASCDLRDYDPAAWPDVRDAATRGVLLEIVRERWGSPALQISPRVCTKPNGCPTGEIMGWRYYVNDMQERDGEAATEEECILAALDASREVRT